MSKSDWKYTYTLSLMKTNQSNTYIYHIKLRKISFKLISYWVQNELDSCPISKYLSHQKRMKSCNIQFLEPDIDGAILGLARCSAHKRAEYAKCYGERHIKSKSGRQDICCYICHGVPIF